MGVGEHTFGCGGDGRYILGSGGWWWVVVGIFWVVMCGGAYALGDGGCWEVYCGW